MAAETYEGGCHCGAVRYTAKVDLSEVVSCNCSRCSRLGWLIAFLPASEFTLHSGGDNLTDYQFNKHVVHHLFCSTCGIESFARGEHQGAEMVVVNARCLDGVDPASLSVRHVDGRNL
ncbi:GFA family protein [Afifella sp. IM 167]|uniref:GFA family protein n=1 Tax=Afifella sp. IM 167 TaxID=2033586 RepID=UPI001CCAD23B|nr:GFA family protein [Afifella sp. IM 167]MBZ8134030.1 aldehyde-activating protein [Afifella sp. IM 167]